MKILYLSYTQKDSLQTNTNVRTKCPWIDAMLDELLKYEFITIALAQPVSSRDFQKNINEGVTLYGLPNIKERNIFKRAYQNLVHATENIKINSYIPQVINDFEPDIVQVFGSENPFGLVAGQIKKPVVLHIQGFLTIWQEKWFSGISKWEQLRYSRLKDLLFMHGVLNEFYTFRKRAEREAVILSNCKYFIGRTDFDKRAALLLSHNSKYFHCEEFIRKDFFETQWNQPLGNIVKCVSILKGTSYKGIELLVRTFSILKAHTSYSFELNICGVSKNEEIIELIKKKYKKEYNLLDIKFLGSLTSDNLVKQLCNSNFYVHPSYIENSPNSVCEAMILGMPVVSTNVGGITSLITDKEEGLLVQEGEPYSMAGAINELINDYNFARLLGKNARKRSLMRHNPGVIGERLIEIYKTILSLNGR
jgi:glycosyltransferase involved in cell wall biosynthesis